MAQTLAEIRASMGDNPMGVRLINNFLEGSDSRILPLLNFVDSTSLLGYEFVVDSDGGDVGERSLNEEYSESGSASSPKRETLAIFGGSMKTDQLYIDEFGQAARLRTIDRRMMRMGKRFDSYFFHGQEIGTVQRQAKQFPGLRKRAIAKGRVIYCGANGGALTQAIIDQAIDAVSGENSQKMIFCSRKMRRIITALVRGAAGGKGVADAAMQVKDYDGVNIVTVEEDDKRNKIFDFNETRGSSNVTQSLYVCRLGGKADEMDIQGIKGKTFMKVRDPVSTGTGIKDTIDTVLGIGDFSDNCLMRVAGILDA